MLRKLVTVMLLAHASAVPAQETDPELAAALAKCPGAAAYAQARKTVAAPEPIDVAIPELPALREELLAMEQADQALRRGHSPKLDVDAENLRRIRQIVTQHGFPRVAQVGRDGVSAAWLLVQHADADATFQSDVLEAIRPRVATGEVAAQQFMLLTDRVLVNQGKPQRYGSQLETHEGKLVPKAVEDEANVDLLRAELGQSSLADYLCVARALYGLE